MWSVDPEEETAADEADGGASAAPDVEAGAAEPRDASGQEVAGEAGEEAEMEAGGKQERAADSAGAVLARAVPEFSRWHVTCHICLVRDAPAVAELLPTPSSRSFHFLGMSSRWWRTSDSVCQTE